MNTTKSFFTTALMAMILVSGVAHGHELNVASAPISMVKDLSALEVQQETEKWKYVSDFFANEMQVSRGFKQKVGSFVGNYLSIIVLPAIAAGGLIGGLWGITKLEKFFGTAFAAIPEATCVCSLGIVAFLLTNYFLKKIGNIIEDEPGQCLGVLTNFVNNWDQHKAQTPQALHPLFEKLVAGKNPKLVFIAITPVQAKKLVEYFVTASVVSETLSQQA